MEQIVQFLFPYLSCFKYFKLIVSASIIYLLSFHPDGKWFAYACIAFIVFELYNTIVRLKNTYDFQMEVEDSLSDNIIAGPPDFIANGNMHFAITQKELWLEIFNNLGIKKEFPEGKLNHLMHEYSIGYGTSDYHGQITFHTQSDLWDRVIEFIGPDLLPYTTYRDTHGKLGIFKIRYSARHFENVDLNS